MFDANTITQETIGRVLRHYQQIGQRLYWPGSADSPTAPLQSSPLRDDVLKLVHVANGDIDRATADDATVGDILERLQSVIDLLFTRPSGAYAYNIPYTFWSQSVIGQVLARVQAWLRQDDLISYSEAAQLLFPDLAQHNIQAARMRVKRLTEHGTLTTYVALEEPNPTQQARVSRQAIEALRAAAKI